MNPTYQLISHTYEAAQRLHKIDLYILLDGMRVARVRMTGMGGHYHPANTRFAAVNPRLLPPPAWYETIEQEPVPVPGTCCAPC